MKAEELIREAREKQTHHDEKELLRRSRITAVVLASAVIVSLAFLIFAFTQKAKADQLEVELLQTKEALEQCEAGFD